MSAPTVETADAVASRNDVAEPRAALLVEPGRFEIRELTMPEPAENEVVVALEGCGLCSSSIPLWEGRDWFTYPQEPGTPGHEGWGRITAVGSGVEGLREGDRVAALSYHAFATHDVAPATEVVPLPSELDGLPFPGEPLGCAMNIFRRAEIAPGQTVAIIGVGFLGALLCRLATDAGARVIALNRCSDGLEMARTMGSDLTLPLDDHWKIIERVKEETDGRFCDRVIEATGKQWPLDLAGELTAERGRLVVAGYHQDGLRQVNMQLWNWRGIDVINAHERDPKVYVEGIRRAVEAVASGALDPSPLYTNTYPLEEINRAFAELVERPEGFMKGIITI